MLNKHHGRALLMTGIDEQIDIGDDTGAAVSTLFRGKESLLHVDDQQG